MTAAPAGIQGDIFDELLPPSRARSAGDIFDELLPDTAARDIFDELLPDRPTLPRRLGGALVGDIAPRLDIQGFPDQPQPDDEFVEQYFALKLQDLNEQPIPDQRTASDAFRKFLDNPIKAIPFIGAAPEIQNLGSVFMASKRLEDGTATNRDKFIVAQFARDNAGEPTIGNTVVSILTELPAFAGEFALTGGLFTLGRKLGKEGVKKLVGKSIRERIEKSFAGRVAVEGLGIAVGGAVQTPAFSHRAFAKSIELSLPAVSVTDANTIAVEFAKPDQNFIEAVKNNLGRGFLDTYIEVASERTGVALFPVQKLLGSLKGAILKRWLSKNPNRTVGQFLDRVKSATAWNGILGEMFEERVGEVARFVTGLDDELLPSGKQLISEAIAFSVPGAARAGIEGIGVRRVRGTARKLDLLTPDGAAKFARENPEAAARLAAVQGVPSRLDFQSVVASTDRLTGPERVRIQQLIRQALRIQPKPAIIPPGVTREQVPQQIQPQAQAEGRRQQVAQAQPARRDKAREPDRPRHPAFKQRRRQTQKSLEDIVRNAARGLPSALEEANDRIALFVADPDNPSLESDTLAIEPDFVDNDPLVIARLRRSGNIVVKEGAGEEQRHILGERLYEQAVQEALGGRAAQLTAVREQALESPEHNDPELVLSSILLEARSTADAEDLKSQRDFFDPAKLEVGDTFTIFGTPVRVEDVEAGRVLTFPEAAIQVPIQFLKNDVPVDMGSFKPASGTAKLAARPAAEPKSTSRTADLIDPGKPFGAIGAAEQPGAEIGPTGQVRQRLRSAEDLVGPDEAKQAERDRPFDLIANEDTRERVKRAREGVTKTGLGTKLDEWWQSLIRGTQRGTLQFLPRTEQFGQARSDLLKLTKARSIAQDRTFQLLKRTLKPLDSAEYELFTLKVLLDDLAHETGELPFGYTADTVAADKSRVDAEVAKSPKVQASIEFRKKMWDAVRGDYVEAMEAINYRAGDRLQKEDYFRHQVLHYMNVKSATKGPGKRVTTPTSRGFLKRRKGSQLDINANYLQAEWEVISQMSVDTQTANTIKSIRDTYDILDRLKKRAKDKNFELLVGGPEVVAEILELRVERSVLRDQRPMDKAVKARLKGISDELAELDPTEPMRRKIAIGMSTLEKARPADEFEPDELDMRKIAELAKSGEGDEQLGARTVLAGITERQQLIREEVGEQFVEWEDLVPATHIAYAIRPGRTIYLAHSIQESLAQRLLEGTVDELSITIEDMREVRGLGSAFRPLVVPNEVAQQLDTLATEPTESFLALALRKLLRSWKAFRLLGPTSILKYNIRNASEIEKVFTLNPKALRKVPQAVKDLYALFTGAEDVPTEVREWAERGGVKSLTRTQELGEVDRLKEFDRFLRKKESGLATKVATLPMSAWRGYWRIAGLGTDYRESILRYSGYLDYLDQMRQGKDNEPKNFGASMPAEIRGIRDIRDRAYKLSADILGDYSDISVVGRELRTRWYPFWSFQELNARAYLQGLRNIAASERMAGKAGAAIARAAGIQVASKSLWLSVKLGRTAILLYGAHALLQAFNWAFFDDEERELPKSVRGRPHIILGRNKDGEVRYFSRLGTSGDFLEWFGLDQLSTDIGDYLSDRRTMLELVKDVALAPATKVIQGSNPFLKGPFELATKRSLFPDIARPRRIVDRWQYIARVYGLEQELRAVTGKPTKGYLQHRLTTLPAYVIEPGRSAYSTIQGLKRRYLKRIGKPQGFSEGGRSDALRNFRLSIRYQDEEGAKRYLIQYISMGGSKQGIKQSLKRMHPLGGLTERERKLFVASLSAGDRELVAVAEAYYREVLLGEGR